ncbi:Response regulator PleD [compost metagenome]
MLAKRLRGSDFLARYGGEEFVMLLPETSIDDARCLLDDLLRTIESAPFHFRGEPLTITCSIGVAVFADGERGEAALWRADQALYRAKQGGRNRLELG